MSSSIVTEATTFVMELRGHKQATTHSHVQSRCMRLNPNTPKIRIVQKKISDDENRIRIC